MTDRETLYQYRLQQAEETLADARQMYEAALSPRSVINRAYYAAFYMILALFQQHNLNPKTSKHSGVIGLFDQHWIMTGKLDRRMGKHIHSLFDSRQEGDYRELIDVTRDDALEAVEKATEFIRTLQGLT